MVSQFLKFGLVGVSNAAVGLGIYYVFIWFNDSVVMAMAGQAVGWAAGVANSFIWNRMFVFKESEEVWWRAIIKMYLAYGFTLLMSLLLTYVQMEILGNSALIVPLVNVAITMPINFVLMKYWSLKAVGNSSCD